MKNVSEPQTPKGVDFTDRPVDFGELKRCSLLRNGIGPISGHCKWCNKALGRHGS